MTIVVNCHKEFKFIKNIVYSSNKLFMTIYDNCHNMTIYDNQVYMQIIN